MIHVSTFIQCRNSEFGNWMFHVNRGFSSSRITRPRRGSSYAANHWCHLLSMYSNLIFSSMKKNRRSVHWNKVEERGRAIDALNSGLSVKYSRRLPLMLCNIILIQKLRNDRTLCQSISNNSLKFLFSEIIILVLVMWIGHLLLWKQVVLCDSSCDFKAVWNFVDMYIIEPL